MTSTCKTCTTSLMGKRYLLHNDAPTCLNCYESKFANKCDKCQRSIAHDSKDVTYKSKHFHEDCFLCAGCNNSLANQQFVSQGSSLICTSCYENSYSEKCEICARAFKQGSQKVEYGGKNFHYDCFICSQCKKPVGDKSFVPNGNQVTCMNCHNTHFASKCGGCAKVLDKGGVKFGGSSYHRECFVCMSCNSELAGTKFTTKDDKPFCQNCYVAKFAKRCEDCGEPISGLGTSTKFCSFDGRHWHTDCFNCFGCSKSLLGEGFLFQDNHIMCGKCAKVA